MNYIYYLSVIVLFFLAVSQIVVGVANDAVNFLGSAFGSKAASRRMILIISSIGLLLGAGMSDGMMVIARDGFFHPEQFVFAEILVICLAVVIANVLLLDLFNTFGLPTSTTVSMIFELLGAAFAISLLKIDSNHINHLSEYLNIANSLAIFLGIVISIVLAFFGGLVVQFFSRLLFSFNLGQSYRWFGAFFSALALTSIFYFILLSGLQHSLYMPDNLSVWIHNHSLLLLVGSIIFWTVLFELIILYTKVNVLKIIVLAGTFSLAFAFAGNDMVNFIGVPLAGFEAFREYLANPDIDANALSMITLSGNVATGKVILLLAGIIMVLTIWFSRKAQTVNKTEINLGRQNEGDERFGSSIFARAILRESIHFVNLLKMLVPAFVVDWIRRRYIEIEKERTADAPAFDLIRASVNLMVSSILIASATALTLPLSTTYVTFMVVMATSLADGAWNRESAVYRINGVISIIGGWFITALLAFIAAFILAMLIYWGGVVAILVLIAFAVFFVLKTNHLHNKRELDERMPEVDEKTENQRAFEDCSNNVLIIILAESKLIGLIFESFFQGKRKQLNKQLVESEAINKQAKEFKKNIHLSIQYLKNDSIEAGSFYVQAIDYLRETAHSLNFIAQPLLEHLDNNHAPFSKEQADEIRELLRDFDNMYAILEEMISGNNYYLLSHLVDKQQIIIEKIAKMKKKQLKQVKNQEYNTRNSMLFLDVLFECKNISLYLVNIGKAMRDFMQLDHSENRYS
jgi:phosphate/sulfate permease